MKILTSTIQWKSNRSLRETLAVMIYLLVIAGSGLMLAHQGWKNRITNIDLIPHAEATFRFIETGALPTHGIVNSYQSFTPPGTAWLLIPGVLIFRDPRLFEIIGSGLSYILILLGIWKLSRQVFGTQCAILSTCFFGFSGQGFFFASSLWPKGHALFFVWMVYWTWQWVKQQNGRFLAAAIFTWSLGLYLFLEIAPAILLLPVVWLFSRPPVRWRSLAIAGIISLLIWLPYLRFEYSRDFRDVRSQILRQTLSDGDERATWCDPTLSLETWPENASKTPAEMTGWWFPQATNILQRAWNRLYWTVRYAGGKLVWTKLWNGINNFKMAYQHAIPIALIWFGLTTCAVFRSLVRGLQQARRVESSSVIALCLIVPWLILWFITDAGRADRFWWLWPVQAIFLAAFWTETLPTLIRSKRVVLLCQIMLLLLIATQPRIFDKIAAWRRDGWSGQDHERVQVSDLLARQIRTDGLSQAAIGYQVLMYGWEPTFHRHDPQYKVGADFDFYLQRKHGIINTNRCAEGIAPFDEYRIVQTARTADVNRYLRVQDMHNYERIGEVGAYRMLKRKEQAK